VTELKNADEVGRIASTAPSVQPKAIRPVLFWSSVGAVCVVIAAYVYTAWIVSGNATPVDPGPDAIPAGTRVAMTVFQIACPILALTAVVYVVRKSLRERALCVEAAVVIGSAIAWWHDPLINWFQPVLFYNAGLVNFGNWMENVPGSLSPGSRFMVEPVLMIGMIYVWMPLAMGKLAYWGMGRARGRWPTLGQSGRSAVAGSRCTSSSFHSRSSRCNTVWSRIRRRFPAPRCGPGRRCSYPSTAPSCGRWCSVPVER
jgi:hypothetical protein